MILIMLLFLITLTGFTQNWIASDSTMTESKDSIITLTLNKDDAYLFRRYITDLEYKSASFDMAQDKLVLLESKNVL